MTQKEGFHFSAKKVSNLLNVGLMTENDFNFNIIWKLKTRQRVSILSPGPYGLIFVARGNSVQSSRMLVFGVDWYMRMQIISGICFGAMGELLSIVKLRSLAWAKLVPSESSIQEAAW
ncbi:hypothetical protein V6N13_137011 [Hibiscus sabdariffa]